MNAHYIFKALDAMQLAIAALEQYAVEPYTTRCGIAQSLRDARVCLKVHSGLYGMEIPIETQEPPLKPFIPE